MRSTLARRDRDHDPILPTVSVRGLDRKWPARALTHTRSEYVKLYVLDDGRSSSRTECGTYPTEGKTADELLEEIERDAEGQANGRSGVVHFLVAAHPGAEEDDRILTSTTFAVEGSVIGLATEGEEAGTPQSLLAQCYRHIENTNRLNAAKDGVFVQFAAQQMQQLQARIKELEADRQRVLDREENLNAQEHKRQVELKEQEANAKLKQSVVDNVAPYASAVVAMFAKHFGITQVRDVSSELELSAKAVAQVIKPSEFEKMVGAGLSKETMLAIITLQETAMRSGLVTPAEKAMQASAIEELQFRSVGGTNGASKDPS